MRKIALLLLLCLGLLCGCASTSGSLYQAGYQQTETAETTLPTETAAPTEVWPEETDILEDVDTQILLTDESCQCPIVITAIDPDGEFYGTDAAINAAGADALIRWLLRQETLDAIAAYREDLYYPAQDIALYTGAVPTASANADPIRLSVSLSVGYSGVLDALLPLFTEATGYQVEVTVATREEILVSAKLGEVDLMLTEPGETLTMAEEGLYRTLTGYDSAEIPFLYCYYVLCGASDDPVGVSGCSTMAEAFAAIAESQSLFISRGDGSYLNRMELALWPEGTVLAEEWYFSVDTETGPTLTIAEMMGGYVLSDMATYLYFAQNQGLV